jgi:hypothetical protein
MKYSTNILEEAPPKQPVRCPLHSSVRQLLKPQNKRDTNIAGPSGTVAAPTYALPSDGYRIAVYRKASDLPAYWDKLCGDNQVFLTKPYLELFEANPPAHFDFVYLVFLRYGKAAGVAACQLVDFNLARNVQHLQRLDEKQPFLKRWGQRLGLWLASRVNFRLLVCGAAQGTGQHAFNFVSSQRSPSQQLTLLQEGLEATSRELSRQGWNPQTILVKDFCEQETTADMLAGGYHLFPFLPNLLLHLRPEWNTFEDYLEAMVSKYRVRARRAFKKAKGVEVRPMSLEAITAAQERMYELYASVAQSADFNLLNAHPSYFSALKRQMGEDYLVLGYYKEDQLIGFCTALRNGTELEAHFLGFDNDYNHQYQLYLNMLYNIVRLGIEEFHSEIIVFSRTATEIKTSVGAEPVPMQAFMRHRCGVMNRLLPFFIKSFETEEVYKQRHPFGKGE